MQVYFQALRATFVGLLAFAAIGLFSTATDAQERQHDRILFLTPVPADSSDAMWVHEMADRLRNRAQNKFRNNWQVVEWDAIRDLLLGSGFDSMTIVGADMAGNFATPLQADAYVYGDMYREGGRPITTFRMVDIRRTGLSGWLTVQGQPGDPPRTFADRVVDSLENQERAARYAKECNMRRDRSEFRRARQAAERAFQMYPNHPTTAQCMNYVFQGMQAPEDSVLWVLEKWTRGDSLNLRAWGDLARAATRAGDTTRAVMAVTQQLAADPADTNLRYGLAAIKHATGHFDDALALINEGLVQVPNSVRFIRLKGQICFDQDRLDCVLEAETQRYELDSSMVGDTTIYPRMLMLATQASDTTAMLRWSTTGLEYQPDNLPFLRVRGVLLRQLEFNDSALTVYEQIIQQEPENVDGLLFVAMQHNLAFTATIDSTTPLDTAALAAVEAELVNLLTFSEQMPQIVTAVGAEYLKIAQALNGTQNKWPSTIEYAEKTLANDPTGVLNATANYFLGIALFSDTYPRMDEQILAAETCSPLIDAYERNLRRARAALVIGRSVSEQSAGAYLEYLDQLIPRPQQFRDAWCGRK